MTGASGFALVETDAAFADLETHWRRLEAEARPTLPYLGYDWVRLAWTEARDSRRQPAIATVWGDGRLLLALPLERSPARNRQANYGLLQSQLLQTADVVLADDADAAAVIAGLFAGLRETGRGASLALGNVAVGSPLHAGAARNAAVAGRSAQVEMPEGFAAFFAQHSSKTRSQHRRMLRHLGNATLRAATADTWDEDLAWFLETKRAWVPPSGEPLRPWVASTKAEAGLREIGARWASDGRAVLTVLEGGGERLSGCLCFRRGELAVLYAVAFRAAFARYSAGRTAIVETLACLSAGGVRRVDLMPFPSEWKERLRTSDQQMATLKIDLRAPYSPDGSPWITVPVAATGVIGVGTGMTGATPSADLRPAMRRKRSWSLGAAWRRILRSMMKLE